MDTKNPRADSAGASLSIAADTESPTKKVTFDQATAADPRPYVSFCQGPDGRFDRFIVQGQIDRDHIGIAAQALVDLIDAIDGDPDLESTNAEDDFTQRAAKPWHSSGCEISDPPEDDDPGGCEHDGREPDDSGIVPDYGIDQTKPPNGGWS